LKEPGIRRRGNIFSGQESAVLRFTDLLTTYGGNVQPSDLDDLADHLDQEQIIELVITIATASWTSVMNDGLHTPIPD
jgi:alkylhydroperoxidase family enzyme